MTRDVRSRIEAALLAQRGALEVGIRGAEDELDGVRAARSDGSADDEHDPEGSTLSSDWSRIQGLKRSLLDHLAETDRALERLSDGGYGTCVHCGRPIALERLEARPTAEHCIECARELRA